MVVPFLRQGGTLPNNDPSLLFVRTVSTVHVHRSGTGSAGLPRRSHHTYTAVRAADGISTSGKDDGVDPRSECRRDGDDFDDTDHGGDHRRRRNGGSGPPPGPRRQHPSRQMGCGTRGNNRNRGAGSSISSSGKARHRTDRALPPLQAIMAISRQVTPRLADFSGNLLGASGSHSSLRPLFSTSAKSLAAAVAVKE